MPPPYIQDLFKEKDSPYDLQANKCKSTTHGINSQRYEGTKLWKSLPEQIKCAENVSLFQSLVNKHIM